MNELLHDIERLKQGLPPDDGQYKRDRIELLISQTIERRPKSVWKYIKDNINIQEALKTMSGRELKAIEDDLLKLHNLDNYKIGRIFGINKLPNEPI